MDESIRVLHVAAESESDSPASVADQTADRFVVDTVADPSSGLDRLASTEYDCLVSGYELPETTGLDFFRRVRETAPALPFVLYAAEKEIASDAITAGVTEYVPPGAMECLAARIEAAVRGTDQQIADRLRRLEELVQTVPTAIVRVDPTGEVAFANDRARSILGFDDDQPLERTYDDPDWEIRDLDGEPIPDEELPFQRRSARRFSTWAFRRELMGRGSVSKSSRRSSRPTAGRSTSPRVKPAAHGSRSTVSESPTEPDR
jgi:PAS domain-containing protein